MFAIHRHGKAHLSPAMRAAILVGMREQTPIDLARLQVTESEGLLASLVTQRARLQSHAELAMEMGDPSAATSAERAIMSNLELTGKLLGQITQRTHTTSTSILISADYLALRSAIITALRPFPEASRAVGAALHQLETPSRARHHQRQRASGNRAVAMTMFRDLARAVDPVLLANDCGILPDRWQADLLRSTALRMLLLCARQTGKTTTAAVMGLSVAFYIPNSLTLIVSPFTTAIAPRCSARSWRCTAA